MFGGYYFLLSVFFVFGVGLTSIRRYFKWPSRLSTVAAIAGALGMFAFLFQLLFQHTGMTARVAILTCIASTLTCGVTTAIVRARKLPWSRFSMEYVLISPLALLALVFGAMLLIGLGGMSFIAIPIALVFGIGGTAIRLHFKHRSRLSAIAAGSGALGIVAFLVLLPEWFERPIRITLDVLFVCSFLVSLVAGALVRTQHLRGIRAVSAYLMILALALLVLWMRLLLSTSYSDIHP